MVATLATLIIPEAAGKRRIVQWGFNGNFWKTVAILPGIFFISAILFDIVFQHGPKDAISATDSVIDDDCFSVVINTYQRRRLLADSVFHYADVCGRRSGIDRVFVIWSEKDAHAPSPESFFNLTPRMRKRTAANHRSDVRIIQVEKNSLNSRFLPIPALTSRAVFMVDDDITVDCFSLEQGFSAWKSNPRAMVGYYPRLAAMMSDVGPDGTNYKYSLWPTVFWQHEMNIVLTKASFFHSRYMHIYSSNQHPQEIKDYVDQNFNCEDLAMSMLVANVTRDEVGQPEAPIYLEGRVSDGGLLSGISGKAVHMIHRSECLNNFTRVYQSHGWKPPLETSHDLSKASWLQHEPGYWWQWRPSNVFEWGTKWLLSGLLFIVVLIHCICRVLASSARRIQNTLAYSASSMMFRFLAPQLIVAFISMVSYIVVVPSLILYVQETGCQKEQYGVILAAFSASSFCGKFVLGYWTDRLGGNFRGLYTVSLALAAFGGLSYFFASAFRGRSAFWLMLIGRALGGCGGASSTLGFSFVANAMQKENITKANALFSVARIFGVAVAPVFCIFLDRLAVSVRLGGRYDLEITRFNSVGLFLTLANLLALLSIRIWMEEPPTTITKEKKFQERSKDKLWKSFLSYEVMISLLGVFCSNMSLSFLETGLAPAVNDALGFEPAGISTFVVINAVLVIAAALMTAKLSAIGVSDELLLGMGLATSILGNVMIYLMWTRGSAIWKFGLPQIVAVFGYPFIGTTSRSIFTQAVQRNEYLQRRQGLMQALLGMVASISCFVTPSFVAAFVLKTPSQVSEDPYLRELSPFALLFPVLEIITLTVLVWTMASKPRTAIPTGESDCEKNKWY